MFLFFTKHRFHESVACAALLASAVTLHVLWICNLLIVRVPFFEKVFTWIPSIGPVSGLYAKAFCSFIFVFFFACLFWRGKDCSDNRKHLLHVFLISTLIYFIMTLPFIYSFAVTVE